MLFRSYGQPVTFLGDGVPVFCELITEKMEVPYSFAPAHVNKQRAAAVAALGLIYYREGKTETANGTCTGLSASIPGRA